MKILLIGEYSNVHATLAEGLRHSGHQLTVVSNGDFWKDYPRDIDVARMPGQLGGIRLMVRLWSLLPKMRGYDVVQLINPLFFDVKAERLFFFYNYLRRHNRRVILGAFGMDWYWVHTCTFDKPLRYSDFNIGSQVRTDDDAVKEQQDWLGTAKERLNRLIADNCDGIVTGLYEYHACYQPVFPDKTRFIPFPIRVMEPSRKTAVSGPIRIFIGISKQRSAYKGTDIMLKAAKGADAAVKADVKAANAAFKSNPINFEIVRCPLNVRVPQGKLLYSEKKGKFKSALTVVYEGSKPYKLKLKPGSPKTDIAIEGAFEKSVEGQYPAQVTITGMNNFEGSVSVPVEVK